MREHVRVIAPKLVGAQQKLCKIDETAAIAYFLVALIQRNKLSTVWITFVVKVLRPQTLVFLCIDEILNFTGNPSAVVELEAFE